MRVYYTVSSEFNRVNIVECYDVVATKIEYRYHIVLKCVPCTINLYHVNAGNYEDIMHGLLQKGYIDLSKFPLEVDVLYKKIPEK